MTKFPKVVHYYFTNDVGVDECWYPCRNEEEVDEVVNYLKAEKRSSDITVYEVGWEIEGKGVTSFFINRENLALVPDEEYDPETCEVVLACLP